MSTRIVIAGAGGFGRGVFAWLALSPRHRERHSIAEVVFIDDREKSVLGATVIGSVHEYMPQPDDAVLCAVGDPMARRRLVGQLRARNCRFHSFVDDRATLAANVEVASGTIICPGAVISADASLGEHVHVNFNCSIGHDTRIGAFSTLSPAVNVMGEVEVGESVFFGGSATVLPRLAIGDGTVVGAGALVTRSYAAPVTLIGSPARPVQVRRGGSE